MDDFSKMKYDIHDLPKGECVVDKYPELLDYPEFSDKENDTLIRIAFLATDQESPFVRKHRDDYEKRMRFVFAFLKLNDEKLINELLVNLNHNYSRIVNRFFVLCDNLAYVMWSDMLFNFHMMGIAMRMTPDIKNMTAEMDKRAKLQTQRKNLHEELVRYESQIFPDSVTRKIMRDEVAKILQFPEMMAQEKSPV